MPVPLEELEAIRVEPASPAWETGESAAPNLYTALQPHMRLYLLGLVEARLGRDADAASRAAEIETLSAPRRPPGTAVPPEVVTRFAFSGVAWRYLRAELLVQKGAHQEALRWMDHAFNEATIFEVTYTFRLHLLRARALEALGQTAEANEMYARFLRAFEGADPALEPLLEEARQRMRR